MGRKTSGRTLKALKKKAAAAATAIDAAEVAPLSTASKRQFKDPNENSGGGSKRPRPSAPRMSINEALQLQKEQEETGTGKGACRGDGAKKVKSGGSSGGASTNGAALAQPSVAERARYVGLDCEMVGVGGDGKTSVLARACLVDWDGAIVYDAFVKVDERVTDFRTKYSGVRPRDLKAQHAVAFRECAEAVAKLLKGKVGRRPCACGLQQRGGKPQLLWSRPLHRGVRLSAPGTRSSACRAGARGARAEQRPQSADAEPPARHDPRHGHLPPPHALPQRQVQAEEAAGSRQGAPRPGHPGCCYSRGPLPQAAGERRCRSPEATVKPPAISRRAGCAAGAGSRSL